MEDTHIIVLDLPGSGIEERRQSMRKRILCFLLLIIVLTVGLTHAYAEESISTKEDAETIGLFARFSGNKDFGQSDMLRCLSHGTQRQELYVAYSMPAKVCKYTLTWNPDGKLLKLNVYNYVASPSAEGVDVAAPDLEEKAVMDEYMTERVMEYLNHLQDEEDGTVNISIASIYRVREQVVWASMWPDAAVQVAPANRVACMFTVLEETFWANAGDVYALFWNVDDDLPDYFGLQGLD